MPHAAHFLERLDRVPRSLSDFALELYRDPERVRWILHYAHLPEAEARVAFALGPRGEGPYIVLTRDGHFVTALGADMTPKDLRILSRAQVDTFSARVKDARSRFSLAKEIVPPGKAPEDVLNLLETRAWAITREQLTAIAAWTPIFAGRFMSELYNGLEELYAVRANYLTRHDKAYRNDPDVQAGLFGMWSKTFAVGCRLVLAAMGDLAWLDKIAANWPTAVGPTFPASAERVHSIAMRGAWAAARIGRAFLPSYRRVLSSPGEKLLRFDAALAVTAIGIRHARYRDDARRFVATLAETPNAPEGEFVHVLVAASHRALDHPEAATRDAALFGADLLVTKGESLPDDSPYKYTRAEDVPRDLALLVATNSVHDSLSPLAFDSIPWVAERASAEELYYPEDMARALAIPWTPELIEQVYARQLGARRAPVVRTAARVGRNDKCTCGSGRKFKKCCGG